LAECTLSNQATSNQPEIGGFGCSAVFGNIKLHKVEATPACFAKDWQSHAVVFL